MKLVFHPRIPSLCFMCMTVPRPKVDIGCLPQLFSAFIFLRQGLLLNRKLSLSWLASKRQESVCLQAILHSRMYNRNHIAVPDFFYEFCGSRLSSACLFSKHISDGIISPAVAWTFLSCGSVFLPVQL